jgi:hypothetical protein
MDICHSPESGTPGAPLRPKSSAPRSGFVQLCAALDREQPVQLGFNGDVTGGCSRPVSFALGDYAQLMSDTAEFIITTAQNWKMLPQATVEEIVGRVTQLLTEIRDPKSGEQAEVTQAPLPDGLKIVVRGSESVRAEARRRMSTMSF